MEDTSDGDESGDAESSRDGGDEADKTLSEEDGIGMQGEIADTSMRDHGDGGGGTARPRTRRTTWREQMANAMRHLDEARLEKNDSYKHYYKFFLALITTTLGGMSEEARRDVLRLARWAVGRAGAYDNHEKWLPEQWAHEFRILNSFNAVKCAALTAGVRGDIQPGARRSTPQPGRSTLRRIAGIRNPGAVERWSCWP